MSREIKLRVINKDNEWLFWDAKDAGDDCCYYLQDERKEGTEIQQFSGVFDSTKWDELSIEEQTDFMKKQNGDWKGKEIWEGDIVKVKGWGEFIVKFGEYYFSEDEYSSIEYNKVGFYIETLPHPDLYTTHCDLLQRGALKVIGNIYKNPELLDKEPTFRCFLI